MWWEATSALPPSAQADSMPVNHMRYKYAIRAMCSKPDIRGLPRVSSIFASNCTHTTVAMVVAYRAPVRGYHVGTVGATTGVLFGVHSSCLSVVAGGHVAPVVVPACFVHPMRRSGAFGLAAGASALGVLCAGAACMVLCAVMCCVSCFATVCCC